MLRVDWWTSPPLTHWELITVQWTYSGYRLPTHAQAASRWIRVSTVVKRSIIDRRSSSCLSHFSTARNSVFDAEKFFESRVSRVSLTSLIKILYSLNITHSDRSPILARSAVQSNITSWQLQKLSKRALNKSIELTSTTWLGRLFQVFTTLLENEYFLMSSRQQSLINMYLLPLVEDISLVGIVLIQMNHISHLLL